MLQNPSAPPSTDQDYRTKLGRQVLLEEMQSLPRGLLAYLGAKP
jgi:hypothetical protein